MIPRFISAFYFGNILFPQRPLLPPESLKTSMLNLLYTLSGDGLYSRFSGGSVIPFVWGILGILIIVRLHFVFQSTVKMKINCSGDISFLAFNFIGVWIITPFGAMGSRFWLIPVWIFPILLGVWMADLRIWKWRIIGCVVILVNLILLIANYYIPNSRSKGVINPSVYVGGKYDNTWDYYDHRQIVKKLAQTDEEYIFIADINVFTFYYLMPKEQRHRVKILWPGRTRYHWK